MDIYGGSCADIPIVNRILHQPRNLEGPTLYRIFIRGSLMPQQDFGWRTHQSINYSWFTQEFPGTKYWGYWCRKKTLYMLMEHCLLAPLHTITYYYIPLHHLHALHQSRSQWSPMVPLSQAARGMIRPVPRGANSWNSQVVPSLPPYGQGYQGWKKIGTTRVRNNLHS